MRYSRLPITRTLDSSNLLVTWSNFCFPLVHFYNLTLVIIHSKYFSHSDWLKAQLFTIGRILCLARKWRQKCCVLAGQCTVKWADLGMRVSCFGCELEKWHTFHSFQEWELGEKIAKNMARTAARRQLEERHLHSIILHKILSLIH